MANKSIKNPHENITLYKRYLSLLTLFIYAIVCVASFNALKMGIGLVAQEFDNMIVHFTMFSAYLLPVICFGFFFFNSMVKPMHKVSKIIYVVVISGLAIYNIVGLGLNFATFMNNYNAGYYSNLQILGISFPIDALVINIFILILQAFNIYLLIKPGAKFAYIKDAFCSYGFFKFKKVEAFIVGALGIFTTLFIGDFFNGLNTLENAKYDGKYVFLLLMIFIIPLMNFIYFLTKPNSRNLSEKSKLIINSSVIGANVLFLVLFITFVYIYPDFVSYIGKNLFPVDYTISIPVGPYLILLIITVSLVFEAIYLVKSIIKFNQKEE